MRLKRIPALANIVESYGLLRGNTRISVLFEPLWGIPFVLYRFYLSLYMMECGVTTLQIGYLISIGFLAGIFFSMLGGVVTDRLGRKKTTFIFDTIAWPVSMLIYLFANSFWMFALAAVINSLFRLTAVSFNLLVVEDAGSRERVAAFNFINIVDLASGIFVPLAGVVIAAYGILRGERIFLALAAISMFCLMYFRNRKYTETEAGRQILAANKKCTMREFLSQVFPRRAARTLIKRPAALAVVCVIVLFNVFITIGGVGSLYFAPYMTGTLAMSKSDVSLLGAVYSLVLLLIFVFVNPAIGRGSSSKNLIVGLLLQAAALVMLTMLPKGNMVFAMAAVALYAAGFGVFKPFLDALLAEVTGGRDRAGMYSLVHTAICAGMAVMGAVSGALQTVDPRAIYYASIFLVLICAGILALLPRLRKADGE
jgi:MFS family permease